MSGPSLPIGCAADVWPLLRAGRLVPWTVPPFGYRQDPLRPRDPTGVQIDDDAARVVRQIFTWYIEEGLTVYGIEQRLIARGIPTPTGRAYWNPSGVRKILINPTYRGMAYANQKQTVPAKRRHPLIGREPRCEGGESCGRYAYYSCRGMDVLANRRRREPCHARQLPTSRIDELVWEDVCEMLSEPTVLRDAVQRFRDGWLSGDQQKLADATSAADVPRSSAELSV